MSLPIWIRPVLSRPVWTVTRRRTESPTVYRCRPSVEQLESRDVPSGSNLGITDVPDATTHHVGDAVTYTLTVTNEAGGGPVAAGTPITVTDILPKGLLDISATAASGWSFSGPPLGFGTLDTNSPLIATYTGPYPVATGSGLPAITISATVSSTAPSTLGSAAFVTSPGNQNLSDPAAEANVTVLPAVGPTVEVGVPGLNPIYPSASSNDTAATVTIEGTGFTGAMAVMFGTVSATSFTVNSDTQITAVSPGNVANATVDITVTTPAGTSAINTADLYTYAPSGNNPTLTLTSGSAALQVGQTGTLIAQVTTNSEPLFSGPVTDPGSIIFTATLPSGLTGVSAVGTGWTVYPMLTSATGALDLEATYSGPYPLAPGTTLPDLDITICPTSTVGSSVTVSANANAPISINNSPQTFSFPVSPATSPPPPDLTVTYPIVFYSDIAGGGPPGYVIGDQVSFDFIVSDLSTAGPVTTPNSTTLTIMLPAGLSGVTANGTNWTVDSSSSTDGATLVTVIYTGMYPITPGEQLPDVTVGGTLTSSVPVGSYTAVATVSTLEDTDALNDTVADSLDIVLSSGSTTTTLSSYSTPGQSSVPTLGQVITFTAAVSESNSTVPPPGIYIPPSNILITTGTISFYDGTTLLGSAPLDLQGQATLTTASLTTGSHTITAIFIPDPSLNVTGSSASITQVVGSILPSVVSVGTGSGGDTVNVYNTDGTLDYTFTPFGSDWTGGVRVATGDVTGDGVPDIIVGAGPGGGPRVAIFDEATGTELLSFYAFAPTFGGGVTVAVADVDGFGINILPGVGSRDIDDIIVGAGPGGGPQVEMFRYSGGVVTQLASFFAFAPNFTGGVSVAGTAGEIVVGAGAGGGPQVTVFQYSDGVVTQSASFYAFAPSFTGGVSVAAVGDTIVVGAGAGGGPQVTVFQYSGETVTQSASFFAYAATFTGGVSVATDGSSILTGAGVGGGPQVIEFDQTGQQLDSFAGLDTSFRGGVTLG